MLHARPQGRGPHARDQWDHGHGPRAVGAGPRRRYHRAARNQLSRGARGDEPRPQVPRAGGQGPGLVTEGRRVRMIGYLCALGAGATWGTTGPLSTGLYGLMPATSIGFWRVLIGTVALAVWGLLFRRDLFRVDARGWLLVGLGGGALGAVVQIAYQFAIAGAGVAGAPGVASPPPPPPP